MESSCVRQLASIVVARLDSFSPRLSRAEANIAVHAAADLLPNAPHYPIQPPFLAGGIYESIDQPRD